MATHTTKVDLPPQTTLDQVIVALLTIRRRDVPGDAALTGAVILTFEHATLDNAQAAPVAASASDVEVETEITPADET